MGSLKKTQTKQQISTNPIEKTRQKNQKNKNKTLEGLELSKENLEKEHGICNSAGHDKQRVAEEIPAQKGPQKQNQKKISSS